jgi:hypothetical protein
MVILDENSKNCGSLHVGLEHEDFYGGLGGKREIVELSELQFKGTDKHAIVWVKRDDGLIWDIFLRCIRDNSGIWVSAWAEKDAGFKVSGVRIGIYAC